MIRAPEFSIILAAGKGSRMQSSTCHKVCFPVDGVPAINRALDIYTKCGIPRHIVVVGTMAGQVIETVGRVFPNVVFAFQAEASGTADAARAGLRALEGIDPDAALLLAAGDRLIDPNVLERLFDQFSSQGLDLALAASPGPLESDRGRLVESAGGELLAIVEDADIRQRQVFRDLRSKAAAGSLSAAKAKDIIVRGFFRRRAAAPEKKLAAAFGELWTAVKEGRPRDEFLGLIPEGRESFRFPSAGGAEVELSPDEVRRSRWLNNSIYLAKASALRYALDRLDRDNAQKEEYLSGIVGVLAGAGARFKVKALRVERPDAILGYNDPAELLAVETILQEQRKGGQTASLPEDDSFRPLRDWLGLFRPPGKDGGRPDPLEPRARGPLRKGPRLPRRAAVRFPDVTGCGGKGHGPGQPGADRPLAGKAQRHGPPHRPPGRQLQPDDDRLRDDPRRPAAGGRPRPAVQRGPGPLSRPGVLDLRDGRRPAVGRLAVARQQRQGPGDGPGSGRRLVAVHQGGRPPPPEEIPPPAGCGAWTSSSRATSRPPPG